MRLLGPTATAALLLTALFAAGCGPSAGPAPSPDPDSGTAADAGGNPGADAGADAGEGPSSQLQYVFVIPMENHAASQIFGSSSAPYLNDTLVPMAATSSAYQDDLPALPSEPHYIWMEAGTNAFDDHTFTGDSDPSASNSTASTEHLVTQIRNATNGVTWMSYQEDLDAATGACPVASAGFYAAKHDPFVFFRDVSGNPPSKTEPYCVAHHKPLSALGADLELGQVARYNFITPNLCNDMHGATGCPDSNKVRAGDNWLKANLPPLIDFANSHHGVIFIVWDEPESSGTTPFLAIGAGVKKGYVSTMPISHSSLLKAEEQILGLPILPTVSGANDLSDFFEPGAYP